MPFNVGEVVRIFDIDALRGGESAVVKQVLPARHGFAPCREYLVEFKEHPRKLRRRDDRFLLCIYREEQLTK